MERILLRFTKEEPLRFVGHLDLMRVLERAMRRSGFPIAYSQGFNPRPRMSFASALTLGATSEWELCQLELAEDMDEGAVRAAFDGLRAQLPPGMRICEVWPIPLEKRNPYIQVQAAGYELSLQPGDEEGAVPASDVAGGVREFLTTGPGIPQALESAVEERPAGPVLRIKLPVGERGGVRIRDLVAELEGAFAAAGLPSLRVVRLHRTRLWCEADPAAAEMGDGPTSPPS